MTGSRHTARLVVLAAVTAAVTVPLTTSAGARVPGPDRILAPTCEVLYDPATCPQVRP